jgi:hypothetical protein
MRTKIMHICVTYQFALTPAFVLFALSECGVATNIRYVRNLLAELCREGHIKREYHGEYSCYQ